MTLARKLREEQGLGRVTGGGSTDIGAKEDPNEMRQLELEIERLEEWMGEQKIAEHEVGSVTKGGGTDETRAKTLQAAKRRKQQLQARLVMHQKRQKRQKWKDTTDDDVKRPSYGKTNQRNRRGSTIGGLGSLGVFRGDVFYGENDDEESQVQWVGSGQASDITRREQDLSYYIDAPPPTAGAWEAAMEACMGNSSRGERQRDMEFVREVLIPRLERRRKFRQVQHKVETATGENDVEEARQEADAILMTGRLLGRRVSHIGRPVPVPGSPGSPSVDGLGDGGKGGDDELKEYARLWEAANVKEEKHKPMWATPMRERRRLSMLNSSAVAAALPGTQRGGAGGQVPTAGARVGIGGSGEQARGQQAAEEAMLALEEQIVQLQQKIEQLQLQGKPGDPGGLRVGGGKKLREKGGMKTGDLRRVRRKLMSAQARLKIHKRARSQARKQQQPTATSSTSSSSSSSS
jgi:hypothetical protein